MEGLNQIDVWLYVIFNDLSDYDIIALSGLSRVLREFFDNDKVYTRLFHRKWRIFGAVDPFELNMRCITRTDYIGVCKQFYEWKKETGLTAEGISLTLQKKLNKSVRNWWASSMKKEIPSHTHNEPITWEIRMHDPHGICDRCDRYHGGTGSNVELPVIVSTEFFDPLYEQWIADQQPPELEDYEETRVRFGNRNNNVFNMDFGALYPNIMEAPRLVGMPYDQPVRQMRQVNEAQVGFVNFREAPDNTGVVGRRVAFVDEPLHEQVITRLLNCYIEQRSNRIQAIGRTERWLSHRRVKKDVGLFKSLGESSARAPKYFLRIPRFKSNIGKLLFPSRFERRLARKYLRMRYLEHHGQLVVYRGTRK